MRRAFGIVSAIVVTAAACQAADWVVDPVHSSIGFSVRHVMVSNVKGVFAKFTGSGQYDPADPTSFRAEGTVEAASINTGMEMRDNDLRSTNFLDAASYPVLTFKSTKLKKEKDGSYRLIGELGMHGVTNTVLLRLTGLGSPVDFHGKRIGFSVTGQIERDKWGLTYNKVLEAGGFVVGNEVQLSAEIEMVEKAKPASP